MHKKTWIGLAAGLAALCGCGEANNDGGDEGADETGSLSAGDEAQESDGTASPSNESGNGGDGPDGSGSAEGPGESDDGGGTDDGAEDSTGGGQASDLDAFRIGTVAIRDPHFFAPVLGDVTASVVNSDLNENLAEDDQDDPDGYLDLAWVLLFDELDQRDGAVNAFTFANARCTAPLNNTECSLAPGSTEYTADATVVASGECSTIDQGHLTSYEMDPGPPTPTMGPCFTASGVDITVMGTSFALPLTDVSASAQFSGDPAQALIEGNMVGFLHEDTAAETDVSLPAVGSIPISGLLREEDKDGDGWWVYLSFTAQRTTWLD